jgi:hypothetical protein
MGPWSLVSTFVAPPYADAIVTIATRAEMAAHHEADLEHAERIDRLCRR